MDPVTQGLVIGGFTAAGTAGGAAQSSKTNLAIRRSNESTQRAASLQSSQVVARGDAERAARIREYQRLEARFRVEQAAGGGGGGGSLLAAMTSQDFANATNLNTIDLNTSSSLVSINADRRARITANNSGRKNPFLAASQGALEGFMMGLTITSGINSLGAGTATTTTTSSAGSVGVA